MDFFQSKIKTWLPADCPNVEWSLSEVLENGDATIKAIKRIKVGALSSIVLTLTSSAKNTDEDLLFCVQNMYNEVFSKL